MRRLDGGGTCPNQAFFTMTQNGWKQNVGGALGVMVTGDFFTTLVPEQPGLFLVPGVDVRHGGDRTPVEVHREPQERGHSARPGLHGDAGRGLPDHSRVLQFVRPARRSW